MASHQDNHAVKKILPAFLLSALSWLFAAQLNAQAPRLVNLSTRGQAGTGNNAMIAGFVIGAGENKTVLIRAVGPGISTLVPNSLGNPGLNLYSGSNVIASNEDWLAADANTMQAVGAFTLANPSLDAALVRTLAPGVYTAIVTGSATANNLAIVEVYEVTATTSRLVNLFRNGWRGPVAEALLMFWQDLEEIRAGT